MAAVLLLAKRGPSPYHLEDNDLTQKVTLAQKLFNRHVAGGLSAAVNLQHWSHGATHDLVFTKSISLHPSNSVNSFAENRKWRVSLAASAFRSVVDLSATHGLCSTAWSFGDFADAYSMADRTTKILGGIRTAGVQGPAVGQGAVPVVYYNSGQQKAANIDFCQALGGPAGHEVCVTKVWERVWHNYFMLRIGQDGNPDVFEWANRFAPPAGTAVQLGGLNHYQDIMPELTQGMGINIEVGKDEIDLYGIICYLLGAGPDTFDLNWGNNAGNARYPHLRSTNHALLPYYIYFHNVTQPLPNNLDLLNPSFAGLPQGQPAAGELVQFVEESFITRAMRVIAKSAPVVEDCEAAFWSQLCACFAEYFMGVGVNEVIGMNVKRTGWDFMARNGSVRMPGGSHICGLLTAMTVDGPMTRATLTMVGQLVMISQTLALMRACAETFIVGFQRGARQCGATVPLFFEGQAPADYVRNVGPGGVDMARIRRAAEELFIANADTPSTFWQVTEAMMVALYDARLPYALMFYGVGNSSVLVDAIPYGITATGADLAFRGECLNSVQPAQIPVGLLLDSARGLAAIPALLETIAADLTFTSTGGNRIMLVNGTTGSSETEEALILDSGVNMLGHSIVIRRDDQVAGEGHYRMAIVPAPRPGVASSIHIDFEPFPRRLRRAFVPATQQANAGWGGGHLYMDDHLELAADFDLMAGADLQLGLAEVDNGFTIANNRILRSMLPGYGSVAAMTPSHAGVTGIAGVVTFPRRVRRRVAGANVAPNPAAAVAAAAAAAAAVVAAQQDAADADAP